MQQLIKIFPDKSFVKFDKGKFDTWCVYLYRPNIGIYAPVDVEYFSFFKQLAIIVGAGKVYADFIEIYNRTGISIEESVLQLIASISIDYPNILLSEIWFCVVYAGMVAEENKEKAILKKRIKRLAMHQVLRENLSPEDAAVFSKGKTWRELDNECKNRGF